MRLDDKLRVALLASRKAVRARAGNRWREPEFYVAIGVLHMNVYPGFLARKEEQAKFTVADNCRGHGGTVADLPAKSINTLAETVLQPLTISPWTVAGIGKRDLKCA